MRTSTLLIPAILLFATGCSDGSVAPVTGVVMMDGKPLAGVVIQFLPSGSGPNPGSGSTARTGSDGRYELRQADPDRMGAVVGPHKVVIRTVLPALLENGQVPVDPIPERYNAKTELTFDVPARGTAEANFELSSAGSVGTITGVREAQ